MKKELSADRIMEVGLGFWASKTLLTAIQMGLFSELAKKPMSLTDLQLKMDLHHRSARDFLDALVALGFLQRDEEIYRNSEDSDMFLDKAKPSYRGGFLEMCNARLYGFWNNLPEGLRTGLPQNEAKKGEDFFGVLYADPDRLRAFLKSMTGLSRTGNETIARRFPWKNYKTFADIGTAQGDLAVQIALANPHLTGIGYDLPVVGPIFKEYVLQSKLASRLEFQNGDFFADQPFPKVDVITMGHILHDWDLPQKNMLIAKAFEALPSGGALVIYESLIDDERKSNALGILMSLNMLIETPGGFDYSGKDCQGWLKEAGFKSSRVEHLHGSDAMVIGIK